MGHKLLPITVDQVVEMSAYLTFKKSLKWPYISDLAFEPELLTPIPSGRWFNYWLRTYDMCHMIWTISHDFETCIDDDLLEILRRYCDYSKMNSDRAFYNFTN